jgi:RNA polymerase sigma-70 factor (ECF subfamily)
VQSFIAEGDFRGALEALVHGYQNAVVGFCAAMLGEAAKGEEVAQEVFLAAYKAMPRLRQRASVLTWLFSIARKQCLKALRDQGRKLRKHNEDQHAIVARAHADQQKTPEEELLEEEKLKLLSHGLSELGKNERAPLVMRFGIGLSIAEIASILRISVPSVHRRLSQALQHLRRITQ